MYLLVPYSGTTGTPALRLLMLRRGPFQFFRVRLFQHIQTPMMVFTRSSTTAKESKSSRGASKPKISHIKTTKTTKKGSKASTKSRDVLKLYVKLNAPAEVLLVTLPLESTVDDL